MPTAVPPLLSPYVYPAPQGCLTLVTSVLDATSNWLLLRYIHAALNSEEPAANLGSLLGSAGQEFRENFKVIFVSILRGFEQWREMGKKMGLDFPSLVSSKRLIYINGLNNLTTSPTSPPRNAIVINLNVGKLQELENLIRRHTEQSQGGEHGSKTILIMDGLDFLLASEPSITSLAISRTVMTLRQYVHNTIVTAFADYPLLHNSSSSATPLESEHRAFVTTIAHQAGMVLQLRSLGTGAAKDISGVLRVSAGGAHEYLEEEHAEFEEGDWLYHVKGDGSVRVWGRGE